MRKGYIHDGQSIAEQFTVLSRIYCKTYFESCLLRSLKPGETVHVPVSYDYDEFEEISYAEIERGTYFGSLGAGAMTFVNPKDLANGFWGFDGVIVRNSMNEETHRVMTWHDYKLFNYVMALIELSVTGFANRDFSLWEKETELLHEAWAWFLCDLDYPDLSQDTKDLIDAIVEKSDCNDVSVWEARKRYPLICYDFLDQIANGNCNIHNPNKE